MAARAVDFAGRLDQQALASRALRRPLYERAGLHACRNILDVGCGPGSISEELARYAPVTAVDADAGMARRAHDRVQGRCLQADGARLPLRSGSFDAAVANLVLMWTPDAAALVAEMARVVRPGGVVMATMEPDYGGKIQWPNNPLADAVFRADGVASRGGDPKAGRKLRAWFASAGLEPGLGISNFEVPPPAQDLAMYRRHQAFYRRLLKGHGHEADDIAAWETEYVAALEDGSAMCFVPVFHAIARKPTPRSRQVQEEPVLADLQA